MYKLLNLAMTIAIIFSVIAYGGSTTVDTTKVDTAKVDTTKVDTTVYRDSAATLSDEVIAHAASNTIGCHEPPKSCHLKWPTAWCDPNDWYSKVVSGYKGKVTTENLTWVNDYPWCYYYHCDSGKWFQVGKCQPRASGSGIFCNYECRTK